MKTISTLIGTGLLLTSSAALAASNAKHLPGVFIGATHAKSKTEFTFGVEYEYKFNRNWGAGAVFERTNDAHKGDGVAVALGSVYYHPNNNVRLGLGYGEERIRGAHPHTESLVRVSASYDYHLGDFGVAPTLAVDFVDGDEAWVFGIAIIRPF